MAWARDSTSRSRRACSRPSMTAGSSGPGLGGIEMQSLASGLQQFAQRLIGGIAAVFVCGGHRLQRAGPPGQVGLRQTLSASDGPDDRRLHRAAYRIVYIDLSARDDGGAAGQRGRTGPGRSRDRTCDRHAEPVTRRGRFLWWSASSTAFPCPPRWAAPIPDRCPLRPPPRWQVRPRGSPCRGVGMAPHGVNGLDRIDRTGPPRPWQMEDEIRAVAPLHPRMQVEPASSSSSSAHQDDASHRPHDRGSPMTRRQTQCANRPPR